MERYGEKAGRRAGAILTVVAHAAAILVVSGSGMKYLYPPPGEMSMLIDFQELEELPEQIPSSVQPRSEEVDLTAPVELVQQSRSPEVSKAPNLTPATVPDDFGDVPVDTPEPREEPKLDPRASFPGMARKDTSLTASHTASESTPEYKAGQSQGNTTSGRTDTKPNAHLVGRKVIDKNMPVPVYNVQESGTVVVTIRVDQYGNVQSAIAGADGTTVTDRTLWAAARKAAMETHFNMSADAPALQEGTITYVFKLK